jgi:acyl-[acyl-carrier-protein]-phospholipid O-acyltransferase/long-chain-fatty-acid--[acyl-carrier-protein] ligase
MSSKWRNGFWALMVTQFQNGFSDLALKTFIVFLILARPMDAQTRDVYVALAGALFAAPFILFSMFGGWCADRFSKQKVMQTVKIAEIGIMAFASLALYSELVILELLSLFLMGCHSAIFGPSKYGVLPEILPLEKLSWGNGILELLTFIGIIFGTVAGGLFAKNFTHMPYVPGLILIGFALIGCISSRFIPPTPPANPERVLELNAASDLLTQMKMLKLDRDLWRANWGCCGFWFIATLLQMNLTLFAKDILHLPEDENGYLNAALAIGIGVGSALAGYISRGKIEYGLVPVGAVGMACFSIPMGLAGMTTAGFSLCLVGLGLSAGFFIVPLASVLQHRPAPELRGAVQGAVNLLSFIAIFAVSGVQILFTTWLHLSPGQVFWVCGGVALLSGVYAVATRREALASLFSQTQNVTAEDHSV